MTVCSSSNLLMIIICYLSGQVRERVMLTKKFLFYGFSILLFALFTTYSYASCEGNCINGKGRYLYKDGQSYEGQWLNGKKHGKGTFVYKDKSSYRGDWVQGIRQGKGIYTWANGQTYQGQFQNDKMNGFGIVKYANGARYEGDIKAGVPDGMGEMLYSSGQNYKGQWKNNLKHGQGEFDWPSGRKYVGEFFEDKLTGKGTYTHNNKSMVRKQKPIDPREAEKAAQLYGKNNTSKKDSASKVGASNDSVALNKKPDISKNISRLKTEPTDSKKSLLLAQKKQTSQPVPKTSVVKIKKAEKFQLNIDVEPQDALIRILNIKPKYQPNMALLPGAYEIEVSKPGYATKTQWLTISDKNLSVPVQLAENIPAKLEPKQQLVENGAANENTQVAMVKVAEPEVVSKSIDANNTVKVAQKPIVVQETAGEQIQLSQLKEEIDRLKQKLESNQKKAVSNAEITSTLPEIKGDELARHALIIGNSSYDYSPLKNPANDASDIASTLETLGFKVILKTDVDQEQMEDAIADFGRELTQGGIGLFYYAGHGVQYEGENYLIPLKSRIKRQKDVRYKAVNLGQVLDEMGQARNGLNVAIIDACRNNPLPRSYRSGHRGLARVSSPQGTLIAYATSPGATAADGDGRNGLYTKHLLKYLQEPNITVEQVLKRVARDVREESAEKQTPWMESSFTGEFYFSRK